MKGLPSPPSLMRSLTAGFDVISRHISLIFFSITLDLLLWFGPQIRLVRLLEPILRDAAQLSDLQASESLDSLVEGLERLNLLSMLRSFPVGIPSLMAARSPVSTPLSKPALEVDLNSFWIATGLWLLFLLLGIGLGSLYFSMVAQASLTDRLELQRLLYRWPIHFGHTLLLTIFWILLVLVLLFPISCLLSFLLLVGVGATQFPLFIALFLGGIVVWFLIPLFFSPHGIFSTQKPMWESILQSVRLSRITFGTTTLFILVIILLSQGLDILWNKPSEDSWFLLVGVAGHAFVTAGLLAASFVYYHEAELWLNHWIAQRQAKIA